MKNIPMFTSGAGVASLILEEIPYKQEAYIRIQSAAMPGQLLEESVGLCVAAGAESVYATGHAFLEQYPLHTEIICMQCPKSLLPSTDLKIISVEEDTLTQWREIYNTHMYGVPNASTMTAEKAKKLLNCGDGYFIYDNAELVGIGKAANGRVDAIVSLMPGKGSKLMLALCSVLDSAQVTVEVAMNNIPAMKLYEKVGFVETEKISKWYCVSRKNT